MIFVLRGLLLELKGTEIFQYISVKKKKISFLKNTSYYLGGSDSTVKI